MLPLLSISALFLTSNTVSASEAYPRAYESVWTEEDIRVHARGLQERGIVLSVESPKPFAAAGSEEVSENSIPLFIKSGVPASNKYVRLLNTPAGDVEIRNWKDQVYMAPITIGDQDFLGVVDTGSSDTWVIGAGYKCGNNAQIGPCAFGAAYNKSKTFSSGNKKFSIVYSGESLQGTTARETVKMGNITVTDQQIAIIDNARWRGDGLSSGLIGLSFPSNSATCSLVSSAQCDSSPLFTSMYKKGLVAKHFSIAINRADEGPGALAFGGLPGGAIRYGKDFVKIPMQYLVFGNEDATKKPAGSADFRVYRFTVDGFSIGETFQPKKMQINLDSGTTLLLLPKDIAKSVNDRFVPPAKFNPRLGYTVDCAAKAPKFGVKISGTTFWIDGKDLVLPAEKAGEGCTSAIGESSWPGGLILGAAFMRNVVSVFDVGAAEMRFAARVR